MTTLRWIVGAAALLLANATAAVEIKNVLVLYSANRLAPGNVAADRGLREAIANSPDRQVQFFSEFLDRPDFGGKAYEATETTYLREKYAARPPDAMVAVSDNALEFLLRNRAQLFPVVPVVHAAVSASFRNSLLPLPADVVGVPIEYDFSGTILQALRWHPDAKRLVVVTGASERDRGWEARLRREVPAAAGGVQVEYLAGLATDVILQRLRKLDDATVVFTPGYYQDGDGRLYNPRDAAALMATAATAPVYGPLDTFIGTGVVGSRAPSFEETGRQAAQILNQLFAGASPASLRLPEIMPTALRVDWRQVRRWEIDETKIPADTIVAFREPTFWERYRNEAIIAGVVFLFQAALIAALLIERRRRHSAQLAVHKQRGELTHASRLAVAGELTASIAHEINQPLGAILTNADAAELLLHSGSDRREELRRILSDIRRDDLRASDVIRRLRVLLAKHELERAPVEFNETIDDVATLLRAEARQRKVTIAFLAAPAKIYAIGDPIQIQQVLMNLILNAMDAVVDLPEDRRTVEVSVERNADQVCVAVRDHGHGIMPEHFPKLFDSFFSTKQKGMGLGLSIARTIVEAHGGRIFAENATGGGAVFRFELPATDSEMGATDKAKGR